jgi:pyrroline-5-carboxylate reductase
MSGLKVGIIGAGKMAGALVQGWVGKGVVAASQVSQEAAGIFVVISKPLQVMASVPEKDTNLLKPLQDLGCLGTNDNMEAVSFADVVVLGVKPGVVPFVARDLHNKGKGQLLISIAAGIDTKKIQQYFGGDWRFVRAMPNTAVTVGEGATVYCLGEGAGQADSQIVQKLFSSVGFCERVQEHQIDAVTGVSGSGPAYMYLILEAMADEGVRQGLERQISYSLAAQTMVGAGRMVLDTGTHPGVLKDEVTSPGGSTIAALRALELGGLRGTMMSAVSTAADRCREMNKLTLCQVISG